MWKSRALVFLIPLQFLVFAFQALTGIFRDRIDNAFFARYHPLNGYLLVALILLHIYLNWDWLMEKYGGMEMGDEK